MGDVKRIEPLMLNNKLAVVRINNLIDAVAGDISSGNPTDLEVTDGVVFIDRGTLRLHTAVGYANKRVVIKSTGSPVTVKADGLEKIDKNDSVSLGGLEAIEIISDNANWWIMSSHISINDDRIIELLEMLVQVNKIQTLHLEVSSDLGELKEGDIKDGNA